MNNSVEISKEKCKGCSLCVSVCPKKILSIDKAFPNKSGYYAACISNAVECIGCMNCALICPDGAIRLYEEV